MNKSFRVQIGIASLVLAMVPIAEACTRFLYETGYGSYIVGRSMDWVDDTMTDVYANPVGVERGRQMGANAFTWTSRYGSVTSSMYGFITVDGMNEAGLVANALYLAESDYGDPYDSGRPLIHVAAALQYVLDMHGSVAEVVETFREPPFEVLAPTLPNGKAASGHFAVADATGDSAIIEYIDGEPVVYHSREHRVMTNSPPFDQQMAINAYWDTVGGLAMLPGTHRAADRFARVSWNLNAMPKFDDAGQSIAAALSLIRSISVPIGITDPQKPNIASTQWRTVSDIGARHYYFDSAFNPSVFWVDMNRIDLSKGAQTMKVELNEGAILSGEVSSHFEPAEPLVPSHE